MTNYNNIFLAHYLTKQAVLLHGSSGSGKSATVKALARFSPTKEQIQKHPQLAELKNGFKVVEKRLCYLDSLTVTLPVKDDNRKIVTTYVAEWIQDLVDCNEPTVLFLDEFNRPANDTSFHLLTELLLDRRINNHKISDKVLIVGAANLASEDVGVKEIPDATINRLTNIFHLPSDAEQRNHHVFDINRKILTIEPKLHTKHGMPEITLKNNERQRDSVAALAETGILSEEEVGIVARGRLGVEFGTMWTSRYFQIKLEQETLLPDNLTKESFEVLSNLEQKGMIVEVQNFLVDSFKQKPELVSEYLIRYANSETCRCLMSNEDIRMYDVEKKNLPEDIRANPLLPNGQKSPLCFVLYLIKKLKNTTGASS